MLLSTNKVYGDAPNSLPLCEKEQRFECLPEHLYAEFGIDREHVHRSDQAFPVWRQQGCVCQDPMISRSKSQAVPTYPTPNSRAASIANAAHYDVLGEDDPGAPHLVHKSLKERYSGLITDAYYFAKRTTEAPEILD